MGLENFDHGTHVAGGRFTPGSPDVCNAIGVTEVDHSAAGEFVFRLVEGIGQDEFHPQLTIVGAAMGVGFHISGTWVNETTIAVEVVDEAGDAADSPFVFDFYRLYGGGDVTVTANA